MADEIIEDVRAHPWLILGGIVAAGALVWYLSAGSKSSAPQQFSFSYGPSDAQLQAGTQLAIAQGAQQTAVSLAGIQATNNATLATTQAGTYSNFFNYLTTAGNAQTTAATATANYGYLTAQANDAATIAVNQSNNSVALALGTQSNNNQTFLESNNYNLGVQSNNNNYNLGVMGYQTQQQATAYSAQTAQITAAYTAQTSQQANAYAAQTTQQQQSLTNQVQNYQIYEQGIPGAHA